MKLRFKLLILPAIAGILMLALCVLVTVLSHRFDNEIASLRKDAASARAASGATSGATSGDIRDARPSVPANAASPGMALPVIWGSTLISLALLFALALSLNRRLIVPLEAARKAAESIAAGDLRVELPSPSTDEVGQLISALSRMAEQLEHTVGTIKVSAEQISVASTEIAVGNGDLSQRTEAQAASLQQTSTSVEQMAGTVDTNASNARQANQLALGASEVARRGGDVVQQVVTTMGEISDSSRKIADIIGVIDGIAFQTNILALNAAVEAARAGEQGRGFSVVAAEVRSLAQRSAEAARQIKDLITDSVQRVESGGRLVQEAGSTMEEIVTSVRRVTDIIGAISAATLEQSAGIAHVNSEVGQLDRMTQQNAALVEESAAAAESLKQQARSLIQAIDSFRMSGRSGGASLNDSVVPSQPAPYRPSVASKPVAAVRSVAAPAMPARPPAVRTDSQAAPAPRITPPAQSSSPAQSSPPPSPKRADDDWEEF
jgi:methyl-accepting chemotaxis protein